MDITRIQFRSSENTTALNSFLFYATVTKEKLELNLCYWVYHELTDALDTMILLYIWQTHCFEGFVFIYRNLSSVLSYLFNQSIKKYPQQ